jgi:hypothetical protein
VIVVWAHLAATLYLAGLIWTIQIVHYPLMDRVAPGDFSGFHRRHTSRISLIVVGPMVVELVCSVLLVVAAPAGVAAWMTVTGLVLALAVWVSTFALQVPCHNALARGFDAATHRRLVRSNWLRTAAWTIRAGLAIAIAVAARS